MTRTTLKEKSVIELIKSSESHANYFFGKYEKAKLFPVLKNEGFFLPKHNPFPKKVKNGYQIPEWNVLIYLEKVSQKTRKLDKELLEIIRDVSLYKNGEGKYIDNYRTWWFFVKILLNIPLSDVPEDIFTKVMPIWLTSMFDLTLPGVDLVNKLLPSYLKQANNSEDDKKVEQLIDILLSIREPDSNKSTQGSTIEIKTKIDNYWLEESFLNEENAALIAQKCSNLPIFNLANKIKEIFIKKYDKEDYSSIWLKNLTVEQKKSLHNGEYFLAIILRKLALEKSKHNTRDGSELIKKFLSTAYPHYLFKRLAILLIAENWDYYQKYFGQILNNKEENFFDVDSYFPELSYLLTKNAKKLSDEQKNKLLSILKKGPGRDMPKTNRGVYQNYWKQRWYKTLTDISGFEMLYEEVKKITKKEIVEYGEDEGGWINFDKSPLTIEDFLHKTNDEIVRYIHDYKPTGDFPDSSPEGLQRVFQSAVKLYPDKFTKNIKPFRKSDYHTLSSFFSGLKEAWEDKKDFQWENTLEFISWLINEKEFWRPRKNASSHPYNYFDWTLSSIGYLLQAGCKTDDWAFDENLHPNIEKIITTMIDKLSYDEDTYKGDGVTHALNSSWGKILTALIYLGLREARISDKRKEKKLSKWTKTLKEDYEKALKRNIFEAYTLLGQYLPNLHYIDKEWAETKAKHIHLIENDKLFETFMDGYLFSGRVYEILYKVLNNAYTKALSITFEEKRMQGRLIQHIAIGYLRGNEIIGKNSLIDKIVQSNNSTNIREIIEFLWHQRDFILDKKNSDKKVEEEKLAFKKRVFIFWDYIISFYEKRKTLSDEDKKAVSELSKLTVYLSEIDEKSYVRLLFSAPLVTYGFDSPYFIEYLDQLKETGEKIKTAEYVAQLFIAMLKGAEDRIPDYNWSHIEEIVKYLYTINNEKIKSLANQICIIYAENSNYRLRELYEKNNATPA